MKQSSKTKWIKIYIPSFFLILTTIAFYIVNKEIKFYNDDLYYSTNIVTGKPIETFSDIIQSQIWHYFNWGGRAVAHTLLQFTLSMGNTFANITNVLFTFLLTIIIGLISNQKKNWNYLLIVSMLFLCNPSWKETLFWQSGFANYIYTTIFILLFIYQYIRLVDHPKSKKLFGITIWIIPLGLFAGWSNENMGPTAWICTLGIILYYIYKKRSLPLWTILGNIFCLIGSILVVISPGNQLRIKEGYQNVTYGIKMKIFLRFYHIGVSIYEYLLPTILILCFVLFIYLFVLKMKLTVTDIVFLFSAFLSIGAMILSPHYPARTSFGSFIFLLIIIMHLIGMMIQKYKAYTLSYYLLTLFIWLGMIFKFTEYIMNVHELIPYA